MRVDLLGLLCILSELLQLISLFILAGKGGMSLLMDMLFCNRPSTLMLTLYEIPKS